MNTSDTVTFASLKLAEPLLRALEEKGYTHPSPIQAQAIPHLLAGRDVMGCAQTGTGKTAAFALPILHLLNQNPKARQPGKPRVLVLTPTRELALQIEENIQRYGGRLRLRHAVIFGGVGQNPQVRELTTGVDILVATPGRLLDLMGQGFVNLSAVEVFVLDEADRMLDMGFAPDVRRVMQKLPAKRQSLLFSATMPDPIRELANRMLIDPVSVAVTPVSSTAERIEQRVCHVEKNDKQRALVHILGRQREGLVLVFARTKHGANRLAERLTRGGIRAAAIHGNKSQSARQRALEEFKDGRTRILVATDIAARGIDVKGISLVVNFDLPNEPEAYVHRIGRTARAGADGLAISLCDPSERDYLRDIQRLIRQEIPVDGEVPGTLAAPAAGGREARPAARAAGADPRRSPAPRGGHPRNGYAESNGNGSRRGSRRNPGRRDGRPTAAPQAGAAPTAEADAKPRRWFHFGFGR